MIEIIENERRIAKINPCQSMGACLWRKTVSGENRDQEYFAMRAREERERAAICEDNAVAMAHLKMAEEYDKRARGVGASPRFVVS